MPTGSPSVAAKVVTDSMIFGFDVGSTTANIVTLVLFIIAVLWFGISIAYCISRKSVDEVNKNRQRKSRRQKFEEYWGDVDDSTHSTSALNNNSDEESSGHSSFDNSSNGLVNIPLRR